MSSWISESDSFRARAETKKRGTRAKNCEFKDASMPSVGAAESIAKLQCWDKSYHADHNEEPNSSSKDQGSS